MYTGRCKSCRGAGLGIAPVVVAALIPAVENLFSSLFGGNSQALEAGVTTEIQGDLTTISQNIASIATPGTQASNLFIKIRCLAGDASMNQLAQPIFGGFAVPPGCGYAHQDSRNYARSAVLNVAAAARAQGINVPDSYVFLNDSPTGTSTTLSASQSVSTTGSPSTSVAPVYTPGSTASLLPAGLGISSSMLLPIAALAAAVLLLGSPRGNR